MEQNRKLVFLLPSIAFNAQNVKGKLKTQKKEKQKKKKTQWLAKIGSRLAARGSGSQARTLVTFKYWRHCPCWHFLTSLKTDLCQRSSSSNTMILQEPTETGKKSFKQFKILYDPMYKNSK